MWYYIQNEVTLLVLPLKIKHILRREKNEKRKLRNMINDEKYVIFLKRIISCISHGDYYSVKELSQLELEKMENREKTVAKK